MKLQLSNFGKKLCSRTGILELMDDLGVAMSGEQSYHMLGGGNPAAIPQVQSLWRERMGEILSDGNRFDDVLVNYDTPKGSPQFVRALAEFLNRHYQWDISHKNIAITNGSQSAFFFLFNMLAGEFENGQSKRVLLPLCPEYIGYADQGLDQNLFTACRPQIEFIDQHTFKYHIDFDRLEIADDIGAICVSRPTNPSGNVLTDEEINRLSQLAKQHDIPLLIDNAYGAPFPGIIFRDVAPIYDDHLIISLSLSKLGLPGTRTGIVIANEQIIEALSSINAVVSLANGNLGQEIVTPLLADDRIMQISNDVVRPFYERKSTQAIEWLNTFLNADLPYYVHASEGAMFLWLWCKDLPITSKELYERLKKRGVIVVPGHYFFFGDDSNQEAWPHRDECLRINHSQPDDVVKEGLRIIAEEINASYAASSCGGL